MSTFQPFSQFTPGPDAIWVTPGAKGGVIRHPEVAELMTGRADGYRPLPTSEGAGSDLEESSDQDIDTEFETNPIRPESRP
jgi:hypothetical protein